MIEVAPLETIDPMTAGFESLSWRSGAWWSCGSSLSLHEGRSCSFTRRVTGSWRSSPCPVQGTSC